MPFGSDDTGAVDEIIVGDGISFDGKVVTAAGEISVYDVYGVEVASGVNSVAVDGLQAGVYVISAAEKTCKIFVK